MHLCDREGLADFVVEFTREMPAFSLLHLDQPAGKHLNFSAVFPALCLGLLAANALFDFLQGAVDGRYEPGETVLQDMMTGTTMRAACSFSIISMPVILGILLSVMMRS